MAALNRADFAEIRTVGFPIHRMRCAPTPSRPAFRTARCPCWRARRTSRNWKPSEVAISSCAVPPGMCRLHTVRCDRTTFESSVHPFYPPARSARSSLAFSFPRQHSKTKRLPPAIAVRTTRQAIADHPRPSPVNNVVHAVLERPRPEDHHDEGRKQANSEAACDSPHA